MWWCGPWPRLGWIKMAVGLPKGPSHPGHSPSFFLCAVLSTTAEGQHTASFNSVALLQWLSNSSMESWRSSSQKHWTTSLSLAHSVNPGGANLFSPCAKIFSPHKHSFEDAPHNHSFLLIAHKRVVVYLCFEVKTTPYSGVISKKKKKKKRSSPVSLHLYLGLNMPPNVKPTKCGPFLFWDVIAVTNFFGEKYRDTYSNCPKKS